MTYVKVATCCYCGTRAALQLRGALRHELACGSCGAPLSRLKMLPSQGADASNTLPGQTGARAAKRASSPADHAPKKTKKKKKTKSLKRKAWGEIWDVIEDIFD